MAFTKEVDELGGTILGGEALQPMATATFLRGTRTDGVDVVDNPAPDLKEVLGGYYLVEAADDEHARRIAERCPAPHGYIEVRPIWEFSADGCRRDAGRRGGRRRSACTGVACWRPRCGWPATSTSPRRRPPTRSCWRCRRGRSTASPTRSRRGC